MEGKLEFELSPVSGALKAQGGFRAKFGANASEVVDFDEVIKEAKADGAFFGVSEDLMKLFVRGVLQSMIDNTCKDGRTRKIDDYLSISLKVHGKFEEPDEDFNPEKHELALTLKPLSAFRPKNMPLVPVNRKRRRQFRVYSVLDAVNPDKGINHVYYGHEFIVKGSDFLKDGGTSVSCQIMESEHHYRSDSPRIISVTDTEIRCAWPEDFGPELTNRMMDVSLAKEDELHASEGEIRFRGKTVWVSSI